MKSEKHQHIAGDFFRYTLFLLVPFTLASSIFCYFNTFTVMALFVNPLVYSIGISLIIIVITHDVNDLLDIVGLGKKAELKLDVQYAKDIQEISLLMSTNDFQNALTKVNLLLRKEPQFTTAYLLRGEILLHGFRKNEEARQCFEKVLKLSSEGHEQHNLAKALKAATYSKKRS